MVWRVLITKKAQKGYKTLPNTEKNKFDVLYDELLYKGYHLSHLPNFSKLGKNNYHCHLSYHWVVCWQVRDKKIKIIEIYYVGSRQKAPY